jgi:GTP-binding protein EngB required for normal cell division
MDPYQKTREAILAINGQTISLIKQSQTFVGEAQSASDRWIQTCTHIEQQLMEHVLRIAVVGAIKSGKSTLVNALLGDDHLKRGAGVVTSIVTRVRRGEVLKARLFFKSWDEVNADIEAALVLFPSDEWRSRDQHFDIRRNKDRQELQAALASLDATLRISRDRLNPNSVILASYLKGFDQVESLVGPENTTQTFEGERFGLHRTYVGDDSLAAYLKDIQLEITGDALAVNIEMADCQGSDSPNPLHMAMIQDYLIKAHLIVYVISSRTGLRQADIRFLNIIKQMGIAGNILFVCNCDINEHEQLADLEALVQRMREELAMVLADPRLFVFSALFHLLSNRKAKLSPKDQARLSQWRKSGKLIAQSDEELQRLKQILEHKLTRERSALLLQNQLERLDIVIKGLEHWIEVNRDWLQRDAGDAQQMAQRIETHQGHLQQVLSMVHTALGGSVQIVKQELRTAIDSFFDRHSGAVLDNAISFVRTYRVDLNSFKDQLTTSGFNHALYLVFQDFKQSVDTFMTEKINPEIIGFMGQKEARLTAYLVSVAEPYGAMVRDAVRQYEGAMDKYDFAQITEQLTFNTAPDLNTIKQSKGIVLPPAAAVMHYSAHIKTEAVMRLGLFSLVRFFRQTFKKPISGENEEAFRALKGGIRRMKRETERSLVAHFKDYKENIKFQYILPLADAAGSRLFEALTERFQGYMTNLTTFMKTMGDERSDKEAVEAHLVDMEHVLSGSLKPQISALRQQLKELRGDGDGPSGVAAAEN